MIFRRNFAATTSTIIGRYKIGDSDESHLARLAEASKIHFRGTGEVALNPCLQSDEAATKHFVAKFAASPVTGEAIRRFRRSLFATGEAEQRSNENDCIYRRWPPAILRRSLRCC